MKESSARENVLSDEEIEKVEKSLKSFREELVFKGMVYTGLRVSAFIHMNQGWIRSNNIFVPKREKCSCKKCQGEWTPKTESSERSIPVFPEVKPVINKLFSNFNRPMEVVGTRNNVNNILNVIEERVNIKNHLHPHGLRATFASILARRGVEQWDIKDIMGWAKIEPAQYYISMYGSEQEKRIRKAWEKKF